MLSKTDARIFASRRGALVPLCVALGACATYYEDPRNEQQAGGGSAAMGGDDAAGTGASAGSSGQGGAGNGGVAGTVSASGTESGGGGAGSGGVGGSGGMAGSGGAGGAMAGAGGNAGAGGSAGAGGTAGSGGKGGSGGNGGSAGSGGSSGNGGNGGNGGSGGGGAQPKCSDHPLTAKTKWVVTASVSEAASPPSRAVDGDLGTRWTTGASQVGGEWLQIDFGATVSLTQVTLALGSSKDDYPRKYATRFSNSSQNMAAPVLVSGMGAASTDTVMNFPKGSSGRYVLITQSGAVQGLWWSAAEILAQCAD